MVTLGIVFLMGILGLVMDVGWGYYRKQVAQAAVDSVVLAAVTAAGTNTITCGSNNVLCPTNVACTDSSITTGSNIKAGCLYGAQNGIPQANISVKANTTPSTYNGAAVTYWVQATATDSIVPTFLQVYGFRNKASISAMAAGGIVGTGTGSGGGCMYILDSGAGQALYLNGASLALTCGIYLNSSNSTNAFQLNSAAAVLCYGTGGGTNNCTSGSSPLNMVTGAKIACSGCGCKSDTYYGSQNPSNTQSCSQPSYGSAVADPLAAVPAQSPAGCTATNYSWSNLSPPQTLSPGTYCGGITIGGGTVTFNPGTYILNGGGLKIQGSNTTVSGNGVFFYNTASGYTAGSLLISGQPNVSFKAQSSGATQGIFFMQDHSICPSTQHAINGNTNIKINGTIYAHCTLTGSGYVAQNLLYTGESSTGYYSAIVVDTLQLNGMSNLVLDPTGGTNTGIGLGGGAKPFLIQ